MKDQSDRIKKPSSYEICLPKMAHHLKSTRPLSCINQNRKMKIDHEKNENENRTSQEGKKIWKRKDINRKKIIFMNTN
jgi:hypothetical protein